MRRIQSSVDTHAENFVRYKAFNEQRVLAFQERQRLAKEERPERAVQRLRTQNKLLPRERLSLLLDPGTPFLEFSSLAANCSYEGVVPGGGVITGIGIVNGREFVIHCSDCTVKAGAWYPLGVKKSLR